ncbi:enoyl-CoA hydratase-related protein [Brevibacterium daeguense]|uniref:Enoyl-CoA hydratase-related protein n=1 Tax=Brevibacterium daeguense TaxID=909936 RepID=A0ABP8EL73_9MICO|nr:enoyl-CoA hydratase/isomerase family protein [Brevibacterium daeguense]
MTEHNLVEGFDLTVSGRVGTLVIDRPEKRNALSRDMWLALPDIVSGIDEDPAIDVLILTGAGGHFSAGSDIADLRVPLADFWETNATAEAALASVDIPTIAAIEGNCIGGGTELSAACDIRVAAPGAKFGITAAKLGLVYPPGPTRRLAEIIGPTWTRYLLLTAEVIDTERADSLGFLHRVSDTPLDTARELAELMMRRSPLSQTGAKRILVGEDPDPAAGGWLDQAYQQEISTGQEAFFAKRQPEFGFRRLDWR